MIAILCKKEGDPEKTIPIMREDSDCLATFDNWQDAIDFAEDHILCKASDCILIDLLDGETNLL